MKMNGIDVRSPLLSGGFIINNYNITKSNRDTNGNMHTDLIARKRKFMFNYGAIRAEDAKKILAILTQGPMHFDLVYPDIMSDSGTLTAKVYVGDVSRAYYPVNAVVYNNFTFDLIEV